MRARRTLAPGQKGTKKLLREYGAQLVCVRYRYDAERRMRFTTVELIVEPSPWSPLPARIPDGTVVGVRVGVNEVALQRRIRHTGGKWNPVARVWEMPYGQAMALGLAGRIEKRRMSIRRHLNDV
jgi:hypothetical protein